MIYKIHNDQIILIAGLLGIDEVIGVDNTMVENTPHEIFKKWQTHETKLIQDKIIYYDEMHKLHVQDEVYSVLQVLFKPQYTFIVGEEEGEHITYFYIRNNKGIAMTNDGICEIEYFVTFESFKERLIQTLDLNKESKVTGYLLKIDAEIFNRALTYFYNRRAIEANEELKFIGLKEQELTQLLHVFTHEKGKIIRVIKYKSEKIAVNTTIKIFSDKDSNWLMKQSLIQDVSDITLYRGSIDEIMKIIFYHKEM